MRGASPPPPPDADADPAPPGYYPHAGPSASLAAPPAHDAGSAAPAAAPAAAAAPDAAGFFDIVPRADATSFQAGYLGLDGFEAWVKGDVLVKLDAQNVVQNVQRW
jgi:hypothetical protein